MIDADELLYVLDMPGLTVEERGGGLSVAIEREQLRPALGALMGHPAWRHLSTLTAQRRGDEIEVLYHLWMGQEVTLRLRCALAGAELPSVSALAPTAAWYEREVHDLLGVGFAEHPGLTPLLLPEDWQGPPPFLSQEPDR
ncbi:MAG: NADH-quinone oxidoreductase subunit C [Chloroflexota bacterium]